MKKILPLLALLYVPILSFAYNPANDSDGDSIENTTASGTILDRCPNTPANEIVDSMGCTAIQKQSDLDRDSTPDYLDSDIDGDSISNTDEIKGHTGAAGCFLSGIYIVTNQYSKDSDNDGLEDNNEGSKRIPLETTDENNRYQSSADVCGTSPIVSDTDQDRIPDVTDPCLTELELIPYIYWSGAQAGCVDQAKYLSRDEDNDGALDKDEPLWCLGTEINMPVYTGAIAQGSDGISYLGCSQRQKIAKLQLSSSTNRLQNAEQELNTASGNLAALNADPNADPGLLATTRTTYDNALRFFHESQAEFNKNFSNTQSWTIERKKKKNTWKSFLSGMFQVNRTSNSDLNIQGDPRVGKVKRGIDGYMSDFRNNFDTFFGWQDTGELWARNLSYALARDVKNLAIAIAAIYLLISVLVLLFGKGGDEDLKKWKSGILYSSLGIILMQSAFVLIYTLYNKDISGFTAMSFLENILYPLIRMIEVIASFCFIAIMILSFYKIITAGGDDAKIKTGKNAVFMAIVGFVLLKIPAALVSSIYGNAQCSANNILGICKIEDPKISNAIGIFTNIINFVNGFLGIVCVLGIIYAWFLYFTNMGDEAKIKKAKGILIGVAIGIFIIVASYSLFRFFIGSAQVPRSATSSTLIR